MNVSIVIPTYNRLPILEKCLFALENPKLNSYNTTNQKLYSFRHYKPIFFVFIGE